MHLPSLPSVSLDGLGPMPCVTVSALCPPMLDMHAHAPRQSPLLFRYFVSYPSFKRYLICFRLRLRAPGDATGCLGEELHVFASPGLAADGPGSLELVAATRRQLRDVHSGRRDAQRDDHRAEDHRRGDRRRGLPAASPGRPGQASRAQAGSSGQSVQRHHADQVRVEHEQQQQQWQRQHPGQCRLADHPRLLPEVTKVILVCDCLNLFQSTSCGPLTP